MGIMWESLSLWERLGEGKRNSTENMKAIIIDDETKARQLLAAMLTDYCPQVTVVAEADDLPNGIKAIKRHAPDVVFLDIEMPGHSGLELLDFFNEEEVNFQIIFATAYNQYAIKAFKLSAVDYLLKPIDSDQLIDAVARAQKQQAKQTTNYQLLKHQLSSDSKGKLALPQANGIKFIPFEEILFFKGDRAYTEIYCTNGNMLLASRNLSYFEQALEHAPQFFRSHRSYIVNTKAVTEYVKAEGGYLLVGTHQVGISSEKVDRLMGLLR